MTSISVCIGTYGSPEWRSLAATRAIPSAMNQTVAPHEILHKHADTLDVARNGAAAEATGEWLCFLDADDELDKGYIEAMTVAASREEGPALLQPATLGVDPLGGEDDHPVVIPAKSLLVGNFMVIGTVIRRDQFLRVGGFADLPVFEDWDLWIRAWIDGTRLVAVPDAIYRVHVNETGRNRMPIDVFHRVYTQIREKYRSSAPSRPTRRFA